MFEYFFYLHETPENATFALLKHKTTYKPLFMLKPIITIVFFSLASFCFGQNYRYTFEGELDQNSLKKVEKDITALNLSEKVTIHYKPEKKAGEILLIGLSEAVRGDNTSTKSPVDIKTILISNGLIPGDFNELGK